MPKNTDHEDEERDALDVRDEMEEAAGPLDEDEEDGAEEEGDGEEVEPAAPALTPDEEANADRVLVALRASAEPLDVQAIGLELNPADTPQDKYLAAGAIEKLLGALLERGVAQPDGAKWLAVPPGTLAKRRGELLADAAEEQLTHELGVEVDAESMFDAGALERAGLASIERGEVTYLVTTDEQARALLERGAIAEVESAMAECRPVGVAGIIMEGDPAAVLAVERMGREKVEKDLEEVKGQRERLRAYLRERGVNTHLIEEPPAVAAPVKAVEGDRRETWTKVIDLNEAGLADVARELLKINREEERLKLRIESAKEAHAEHISGIKAQLGKLSDRKREIEREDETGKRTLTREAIVRIDWGADEEVWLAEDTGEEIERKPIRKGVQRPLFTGASAKAEAAPRPAPAPAPKPEAPAGAMEVVPAGAPAEGAPTTPAEEPPLVLAAPDKPKAPAITKENVETALVALVGELPNDTATLTTTEATDMIAERWGIEAGTALGQLVQVAARKAGAKGLLRHDLAGGAERVGRMPAKPLDDAAAGVLAQLRLAGPAGIAPADITGEGAQAAVETLLERGAVVRNGKRGRGARLLAAEHAPKANGAATEARL